MPGIEVSGLNVLDKTAMLSLTGLRIGDEMKNTRRWHLRCYSKTMETRFGWRCCNLSVQKIEGTNVYLSIELTERPRLNDFYFVGISKGSQNILEG
ncbi:MAG: hypothetical protein U5K54_07380 [Cytophagales bacterium]|nr:hypothetical protein [Cytophagales bacterium]